VDSKEVGFKGKGSMKKLLALVLGLSVMCSVAAFAQDAPANAGTADKTAASAPLKTIKGTVKAEGDKISFVSDADQKSWEVMNPEP
jgi:hypothetical protein